MSKVTILSNKIPWFGNHTGYERVVDYLIESGCQCQVLSPSRSELQRLIGKLYVIYNQWQPQNNYNAEVQFRFYLSTKFSNSIAHHILYLENHLQILENLKKTNKKVCGTIHLPPSQWTPDKLQSLALLDYAFILYKRDIDFFGKYLKSSNIHFLRYGVDIDFFTPPHFEMSTNCPRVLFAGHYLRNTEMLHRVIERLSCKYPDVKYDLLVPENWRNESGFIKLKKLNNITWHHGLADEELRNLYQRSYIMLLPMSESGANTAVVESLACGLPLVTTDVGGIRDYGGAEIYPIVNNNDDDGMLGLVSEYLEDQRLRDRVSKNIREFAEEKLDWRIIAQQHLDIYKQHTS